MVKFVWISVMALNTPKRIRHTLATFASSPNNIECNVLSPPPWPNTNNNQQQQHQQQINYNLDGSLSPVSSCGSPEYVLHQTPVGLPGSCSSGTGSTSSNAQECRENRRGRPRSEALTTLMFEGSTSPSAIKCTYCNRVFPREKSLQAHLRTHTGWFKNVVSFFYYFLYSNCLISHLSI